ANAKYCKTSDNTKNALHETVNVRRVRALMSRQSPRDAMSRPPIPEITPIESELPVCLALRPLASNPLCRSRKSWSQDPYFERGRRMVRPERTEKVLARTGNY